MHLLCAKSACKQIQTVGLLDVLGAGDEVASSVVAAACTVSLCACCFVGRRLHNTRLVLNDGQAVSLLHDLANE